MVVDGMDLQMLALALPSISKELSLSNVMAGALSTYTLLGMGVGGILAGWLSDRYGRVRVVWSSVLVFTACTTLIAYSAGYWHIALMRFVSGFGISGLYTVGTLLATECAPTRIRTTVLGVLQAGWSVGYVIAALLAAYLLPHIGWRPLFLCALAPGAVALVLLWRAPEPASWSVTRTAGVVQRNAFLELWRSPAEFRVLALWTITTIALQFGYYGANSWLPSYLVSDLGVDLQRMGWYVAATYTMMVVGKIVTGYLADIYGRRAMWIGSCLLTAVYLPAATYFATSSNVAFVLVLFGLLYGAPYTVSATYIERELSHADPRDRRGRRLQPRADRCDVVAAARRGRRVNVFHRVRHQLVGRVLCRLRTRTRLVHQGEAVRTQSRRGRRRRSARSLLKSPTSRRSRKRPCGSVRRHPDRRWPKHGEFVRYDVEADSRGDHRPPAGQCPCRGVGQRSRARCPARRRIGGSMPSSSSVQVQPSSPVRT